jgi:monolysocardiolipin acyltransferase
MARTSRVARPIGAAFLALGGTYYYYKTPSNPNRVPYVPAPFVWSSIPTNIEKRYTSPLPLHNGVVWNALSTAVVGGAGTLAKLFLKCNKVTVYNLDGFRAIVEDPQRERGIITGK